MRKSTRFWSVFLALVLVLSMVFSFAAMAADVPGAQEQAAMYNHHRIPGLEGLENGRDLGGYITPDGRQIKFGLLLRTAKLADATDGDLAVLEDMDVSKVIDLRMLYERVTKPDQKVDGAENVWISTQTIPNIFVITGEDWMAMLKAIKSGVMDTYMTNMYRQLISDPIAICGTRRFFNELLESNGETVLWHCTSGKDRTGIEAVMLMAALGFDEEQIRAEYLNTNVLMADEMQAAYDKAYKYTHSNKIATEFFKYEGVQESWLDVALSVVDRYGGLDSYLRGTIGLTDADFAQLQQIYLEPAA